MDIAREIKATIELELRPLIKQDGGDIEFVSFENGVVIIKFLGACTTCPYSFMTLKMGILDRLAEKFPEVKNVTA